ncbi:hypothetical protein C6Y45_02975 [Alkalicoccus saliphilus]|uniref:Uncharacterized protein n=1 Tax=Alkalicoccus saliphilus TaxID=200989 RepID=A0A2T4U973_9BACI|nr:hypothetical protein C6Y45_02975 [Alkalicoccus saliphilus]
MGLVVSYFQCLPALKRIFRLRFLPPASPPVVPEEKASPEWKKGRNQHVFRRETFFLFSCWSCSRRLRGEIGRAEDPFLPSMERKKLAEAGPPGKLPVEAKAGRYIHLYKKDFINSLKGSWQEP